jgi:hypothetical protein
MGSEQVPSKKAPSAAMGQFPSVSRETTLAVLENASVPLTKQGQAALVQLLNLPAQPTRAMQDLMALPDLPRHSR